MFDVVGQGGLEKIEKLAVTGNSTQGRHELWVLYY